MRASIDATQLAFGLRQLLDNAADVPRLPTRRSRWPSARRRRGRDRGERPRTGDPAGSGEVVFDRFAVWRPGGLRGRRDRLGLHLCRIAKYGGRRLIADGSTGVRCSPFGLVEVRWAPGDDAADPATTKGLTDALATVVGLDDGLDGRPARPRSGDGDELSAEHLPTWSRWTSRSRAGCRGSRRCARSRRSRRRRRS